MRLNKSRGTSSGIVYAIVAPLLYAIGIPFSKVFVEMVSPFMLGGCLYLGAGLGLTVIYITRYLLFRQPSAEASIQKNDLSCLGASILTSGVLGPVLLIFGLSDINASSASLLLNLEAAFTTLIACILFGERFTKHIGFGLGAITVGSFILFWNQQSKFGLSWGVLAVVGTCLFWAFGSNFTRKIAARDCLQVVTIKSCAAGGINVILALTTGESLPNSSHLLTIGIVGFVSEGLSFVFMVLALRYIGASRTATYFSLAPFWGAVLAVTVLGENITPNLFVATGFMVLGFWFCLTEKQNCA